MENTRERRGTLSCVLGESTRIELEAVVGKELPLARYVDIVALITQLTHRQGQWVDREGALDWSNSSDVESLQITAQNREGATHLCICADYGRMASFAFFAVVFSVMFLTAAIGGFVFQPSSIIGIAATGIVGVVVSFAVARAVWRHFAGPRRSDMEHLLEELVAFVGAEESAQE